jgi:hypothetical protein
MHILFGALAGAGFAVLAVAAIALISRRRPSLKSLLIAAAGGAVAGAVTTATLGASSAAGVTLGKEVVAFAAGGASGGATERAVNNVVEGRPLGEGVIKSTVLGAGAGVVSLAGGKALQSVLGRIFSRFGGGGSSGLLGRLFGANTPSTGSNWLRSSRVPGTGAGVASTFSGEGDPDAGSAGAPGDSVEGSAPVTMGFLGPKTSAARACAPVSCVGFTDTFEASVNQAD